MIKSYDATLIRARQDHLIGTTGFYVDGKGGGPNSRGYHSMATSHKQKADRQSVGKLRIGDDWSAISIIALSQSNPLKAVAEFVENSIDARATRISIIRGRERGQAYLKIIDDGEGIPLDSDGKPDFKYVATHICDSLKRQMKARGAEGIQGEFGIGLLSFWTVGESLSLVSPGSDGKLYEMRMARGDPRWSVTRLRRLLAGTGTELTIRPLLPGIRQFSGEKLQWFLASELRDRIRQTGVEIVITDRQARAKYRVEPREFAGRLLHHVPVPRTPFGDAYVELYLADPGSENRVSLYRSGTRVLENIADIDELNRPPWTSGYIQGILDAPFLQLTPGTRLGVIREERFAAWLGALGELESALAEIIRQQERAAQEQANRDTLQSIRRAFREAMLALPEEEYDWFEGYGVDGRRPKRPVSGQAGPGLDNAIGAENQLPSADAQDVPQQRQFFEHPGPLCSVRISPARCAVGVGQAKSFRAVARDRGGRHVDRELVYAWRLADGQAELDSTDGEIITLTAPPEPQLVTLAVHVTQGDVAVDAEALVTVTDSLLPERPKSDTQRGLPEYTYEKLPGELRRSRFDREQNLIVINSGHRDFVYVARNRMQKLRYVCRLFAKELVIHNFPGYSADQLLERMIELSLYTEENLR